MLKNNKFVIFKNIEVNMIIINKIFIIIVLIFFINIQSIYVVIYILLVLLNFRLYGIDKINYIYDEESVIVF